MNIVLYFFIQNSSFLIISSDTIVVLDNQIYEKPKDDAHAVEILKRFVSIKSRWCRFSLIRKHPPTINDAFTTTSY